MSARGTLSHALHACVGVGGAIELAARTRLADLWRASAHRTATLAAHLGVSQRSAQRLLVWYGLRARDARKVNRRHRSPRRAAA